ncbi:MAG TPA: hypothetical protein VFI02_04185 [Armatimonadota bacterium]|nr:hypothetical protein [Armatimonadota bacterium]
MWKRVPWVNLWMMAFGGVGIWIIADTFFSMDSIYTFGRTVMTALVILGVVGLVGFARLPLSFFYETGPKKMINLNDLAGIYLKAWKGLWRRKWIVLVFGVIAALSLTGVLTEATVTEHYLAARANGIRHANPVPIQNLPLILSGSLPDTVVGALQWFFPRSGLGSGTGEIVVIAAVLLLALPWLYLRLGKLHDDEEYAGDARFLQLALVSCGIVALAVLVVVPRSFVLGLQNIAKGVTISPQPMRAFVVTAGVWMLVQAILNAAIISAVIGSLKQGDGRVTLNSFLKASVCYFKPIAGLFLLIALSSFVLQLPEIIKMFSDRTGETSNFFFTMEAALTYITLLLMLVPFATVVRNLGVWQGIKHGVKDWIVNAGHVISFIALGITFLVPVLMIELALSRVIEPMTGWHVWTTLVYPAVNITLTAVTLLAVWEFYQLISKGETVERTEA